LLIANEYFQPCTHPLMYNRSDVHWAHVHIPYHFHSLSRIGPRGLNGIIVTDNR
jgi:hypothetical protein